MSETKDFSEEFSPVPDVLSGGGLPEVHVQHRDVALEGVVGLAVAPGPSERLHNLPISCRIRGIKLSLNILELTAKYNIGHHWSQKLLLPYVTWCSFSRLINLLDWFLPVNRRKLGYERAQGAVVEIPLVTSSKLGLE